MLSRYVQRTSRFSRNLLRSSVMNSTPLHLLNPSRDDRAVKASHSSSFHTTAPSYLMGNSHVDAKYKAIKDETLFIIAALGDQEAREEKLIREIMSVDKVSWEDAQPTYRKIKASNRNGLFMATLPYKVGIFTAVTAGVLSIPMIFSLDTVMWFNEAFVTSDVPEEKDLQTPLEVGSWAWGWMEPPLGQISFFLLCMQYARSQLENLGAKPYTAWFKAKRADRLCREFPKYDPLVVGEFSEGDPLSGH